MNEDGENPAAGAGRANLRIYEDSWSEWLDMKQFGPSSRWLRLLILDALRTKNVVPRSVLDAGCGEGIITDMLAREFPGAVVVGTDQSPEAIRLASARFKRSGLRFGLHGAECGPGARYDLITCLEVLEHVEHWQRFLQELCGHSARYLLLSFPTGRMRSFEKYVGHVRNFASGEVEQYLESQGFLPLWIAYAGFPFYSPLYRELCQLTNAGTNQFTRGRYTWKQKVISELILFAFRHLSTQRQRGDQFVGLFQHSDDRSRQKRQP